MLGLYVETKDKAIDLILLGVHLRSIYRDSIYPFSLHRCVTCGQNKIKG